MKQNVNQVTNVELINKWSIWSHFSSKYNGFAVEHRTTDKDDNDVRGFEEPCVIVVKYNDKDDKIFLLLTYAIHDRKTGEVKYDTIPYDVRVVDKKDAEIAILSAMLETDPLIDEEVRAEVKAFTSKL